MWNIWVEDLAVISRDSIANTFLNWKFGSIRILVFRNLKKIWKKIIMYSKHVRNIYFAL